MPSLPFFGKKKEESTGDAAPATSDAPATEQATETAPQTTTGDAPTAEHTSAPSDTSAPAVEKTVVEPPKRSFFGRRKSVDNGASESESESGPSHSRLPSFFGRKAKPATSTVKEEEKENVPATATDAPTGEAVTTADAPATEAPVADKKDGDKVRRRISLFQRRNRAEGGASEGEVSDGESKPARRVSLWGGSGKDDHKEPAPEDPRITEAKRKITDATEAETAAKSALEAAKSALREARTHLKTIEAEVAADLKKLKGSKKEDSKPTESGETGSAPQTAVEPPALPQVTAAA